MDCAEDGYLGLLACIFGLCGSGGLFGHRSKRDEESAYQDGDGGCGRFVDW